jgi:hypothetical protein
MFYWHFYTINIVILLQTNLLFLCIYINYLTYNIICLLTVINKKKGCSISMPMEHLQTNKDITKK